MNFPLFPAPPTLDGAAATFRDVSDVRTTLTTLDAYRGRHVSASQPRKHVVRTNSCTRDNNTRRRSRRVARFVNVVHPRENTLGTSARRRPRGSKFSKNSGVPTLTTEFRLKMTECCDDDQRDDADVICASVTPISCDSRVIPEDTSNHVKDEISVNQPLEKLSTGVQTCGGTGPYRLRVLPSLKDIVPEDGAPGASSDPKKTHRICWHLRFLGRISLCQFGLAWLLTFWAMAGAASFYATEGPREREQVVELKEMQRDLAVGLATELRQMRAGEEELEPLWSNKVQRYVAKHEKLLLAAVSSGYGEGGDGGQLWTFPGCLLFSISLLTTLGFGAPVPRTTAGRTVAVIFAAIGIPAHFLLVLNLGLLLAMRLQRYGIRRKYSPEHDIESRDVFPAPKWVKIVPFGCIVGYYLIGILGFGVGRSRPFAASLLFPLDFTAAGGLATTSGLVRVMYGVYLEGAVTIAAVAVAVLQVSATRSLTNVGLKYGLLIEA